MTWLAAFHIHRGLRSGVGSRSQYSFAVAFILVNKYIIIWPMLHLVLKNRDSGESKVGGKVDSPTFTCPALPKQNHLLCIFSGSLKKRLQMASQAFMVLPLVHSLCSVVKS